MLPDRRLAFQDGLPTFGLYLGDFETEAREKVVEDHKRTHATNGHQIGMGNFNSQMSTTQIISQFIKLDLFRNARSVENLSASESLKCKTHKSKYDVNMHNLSGKTAEVIENMSPDELQEAMRKFYDREKEIVRYEDHRCCHVHKPIKKEVLAKPK